jgi:hypothetical protein
VNLASIPPMAQSPVYQAVLGWFAWFLPMSVPNTLLGLAIFVLNRVAAFLSLPTVTLPDGTILSSAPPRTRFDWMSGTVITVGGWMVGGAGGYNNGNFAYVHMTQTDFPDTPAGETISSIIWHETGHTLDNAALGWMFQLVGSVSSRTGLGSLSYGECTAESRRRFGLLPGSTPRPYVPFWGLTPNTPPVAVITVGPTRVGSAVTVSGSMSDPESTSGTFEWSDVRLPAGSTLAAPVVADLHAAMFSFTPDVAGFYSVGMRVNDGIENSLSVANTFEVTP